MSTQAGVFTKNENLSAKALKRIFRDGGVSKKSGKKQKAAKSESADLPKEKIEEIPDLDIPRWPGEELEKRRRLQQEAAENFVKCRATPKEQLAALSEAKFKRHMKIMTENEAVGLYQPPPSPS